MTDTLQPQGPDDLLTRAEVAAWLRCTRDHLARMAMLGQGPRYVKLSASRQGQTRYRRADVLDWLERQSRGGERVSEPDGAEAA